MKLKQFFILGIMILVIIILSFTGKDKGKVLYKDAADTETPVLNETILSLFPDSKELIETDSSVYQITGVNDSVYGYVIYTSPFTDHILGYGGPTPLEIITNPQQQILKVSLLPRNEETPSYIEHVKIEGLFEEWDNLNITEALDKKVEAVSGATMSSESVIETMHHRLAMINNSSFEKPFNLMRLISNAATLIVLILAVFCFFNTNKNLRLLVLALSVLVLGFWQGRMLSLASDYNWLINGINWTASWTLILILSVSIILPLISGKSFYCTYMCPYGALQELIGKITKRKLRIPDKLRNVLLILRPVYLILIIIALLIGLPVDLANFEPFAAFAIQSASTVVLILAGFFLGLSVFIGRPWCKYFCPTGTLLDQFKRKKSK